MQLYLRRTDSPGSIATKHFDGDIVSVWPDDHVFGPREDYERFITDGRWQPADWHGRSVIIRLPGIVLANVRELAQPGIERMWSHNLEFMRLERRAESYYEAGHPLEGRRRDTLRAYQWIERGDVTEAQLRDQTPANKILDARATPMSEVTKQSYRDQWEIDHGKPWDGFPRGPYQ